MRNRRGLSTIVGAVFFVIAATTIITYVSYSMNSIDQFSQSVIVSESENIDRGREEIKISQATIVGGEFNMTVVNTGSLPVQLTRLWVTNNDSTEPDKKADLDIVINTGNEKYNIGQGTGIAADSTVSYTLKAVTERGNISTFQVSPDASTQLQLLTPASVDLSQDIKVTAFITNNSTSPNNIANLIPEMITNVTLTQINGPLPASIQTLPQGNTAVINWKYQAPATAQGVLFNASYTGAPPGAFVFSNTTVAVSGEAEAASTSDWSQAAKRVGILISGIPNPVESSGTFYYGKFGIGIINPLDRPVQIYSVGVLMPGGDIFWNNPVGVEPTTGWRHVSFAGGQGMMIWEGGTDPVEIAAQDVGQFRMQALFKATNPEETLVVIQALSSEGKLNTIYSLTADSGHPTINTFYTTDPSDPGNNWGYLIPSVTSGQTAQIFNATVENAADNTLNSETILIILLPSDFTNVAEIVGGNDDWDDPVIVVNPDGSNVITVNTTSTTFPGLTYKTFQFTADAPTVVDETLYVLQTTTIYPSFTSTDEIQLASALSEAGIEVLPP